MGGYEGSYRWTRGIYQKLSFYKRGLGFSWSVATESGEGCLVAGTVILLFSSRGGLSLHPPESARLRHAAALRTAPEVSHKHTRGSSKILIEEKTAPSTSNQDKLWTQSHQIATSLQAHKARRTIPLIKCPYRPTCLSLTVKNWCLRKVTCSTTHRLILVPCTSRQATPSDLPLQLSHGNTPWDVLLPL